MSGTTPQGTPPVVSVERRVPLETVERAWARALSVFTENPALSLPLELPAEDTRIAFIDLVRRQIFFSPTFLEEHGCLDSLPALLAHEIGHHLDYPHTLRTSADLELTALELFDRFPPLFLNLFYDLLINEQVGRQPALRRQLLALYVASTPTAGVSPLFAFYLAIYEALWAEPGAIVRDLDDETRDKADLFAQTFFSLSTLHEQFVFFCSAFAPFILQAAWQKDEQLERLGDLDCPSADDYSPSMRPSKGAREALDKARKEGWFPDGNYEGKPQQNEDAFARLQRLSRRPGSEGGQLREALVDRIYRKQIEETLAGLHVPPLERVLDPFLPSSLDEWDAGDDFARIDWVESVNRRGSLAAVSPLQRELITDEEPGEAAGIPRLELYLDTSGSMPNPTFGLNAMTLAAQVLATLAIRRGSAVRGIIYSAGPFHESGWMRSEEAARSFFFQYIGGGTDFPFERCAALATQDREVNRVVISDSDFTYNLNHLVQRARPAPPTATKQTKGAGAKGAAAGAGSAPPAGPRPHLFEHAVERSRHLALLLLGVDPRSILSLVPGCRPTKLSVIQVPNAAAFSTLAGQLADSLFPVEQAVHSRALRRGR